MNDLDIHRRPTALNGILADTEASGFNMVSEQRVGALLAALPWAGPLRAERKRVKQRGVRHDC